MPLDPNRRFYTPDFQANTELPTWQPMGQQQDDQSGAATGSFVDMLKKRMSGSRPQQGGPAPSIGGGSEGGGGMQSL